MCCRRKVRSSRVSCLKMPSGTVPLVASRFLQATYLNQLSGALNGPSRVQPKGCRETCPHDTPSSFVKPRELRR